MRRRSWLFLIVPILAVAMVAALLYAVRSAQPAASAAVSSAGSTPAVPPPSISLLTPADSPPADAPSVAAPSDSPPTESAPVAAPVDAPAHDDVVAVVATQVLTRGRFELVQAVDAVMSGLLGLEPAGPDALLEQMINHALVAQQMADSGPAPVVDSAARLQDLLRTADTGEDELDAALAAAGVTQAEFEGYFAELLAVEAFARQAAEAQGGDIDIYVAALQARARISYGPAAAQVRTEAANSQAPTMAENNAGEQNVGGAAVASSVTAASNTADGAGETRGLAAGQLAPDFALRVLGQQQQATFADLPGKPAVLSFWTTWCPYCLRQTPVLVAAAERHPQEINFIGINVAEDAASVTTYVEQHRIPYTILLDQDGQVAAAYAVEGYPTTYFLDSAGHIAARHIGALTEEQLTQYLEQLLATQ